MEGEAYQSFELADVWFPSRFTRTEQGTYVIADTGRPLTCVGPDGVGPRQSELIVNGVGSGTAGRIYALEAQASRLWQLDPADPCSTNRTPLFELQPRVDDGLGGVGASIVERPDGLLLIARQHLAHFVDVRQQRLRQAFYQSPLGGPLNADDLALVPGATWTDPWLDGDGQPAEEEGQGGEGEGPEGSAVSDEEEDGGCGCQVSGPAAAPGLGLLITLLGTLGVLRRR